MAVGRLNKYRWVEARSYTSGRRKSGWPNVIFVHTTEGSEGRQSAEDGAAYDARRDDGTSAHFMVDQDTVIQEVLITDEAHAARTHGNDCGVQIEVCGKAGQSKAQWEDEASAGSIEQLALLCVDLRAAYPGRFPMINLTPTQLRAGQNGFAEHYDATKAWPEDGGTHTDPGPNFPWTKLFARITELEIQMANVDITPSAANALAILGADVVPKDGGTGKVDAVEALRQTQVAKNRITELTVGIGAGQAVPAHMGDDGRSIYQRLTAIEQTLADILAKVTPAEPTS
jgi:N-acetyl-anhydromuramyl-L-alanine amidase AmpD